MSFDIYIDGRHMKVSSIVGEGLTKFEFVEIVEPEPEQVNE